MNHNDFFTAAFLLSCLGPLVEKVGDILFSQTLPPAPGPSKEGGKMGRWGS